MDTRMSPEPRSPRSRSPRSPRSPRRHSPSPDRERRRSPSPRSPRRRRSFSRSPRRERSSSPPRYRPQRASNADKESPEPCNVLGVFGLSLRTTERDLDEVYSKFGKVEKVNVVYDAYTRKSRGFGFVSFSSVEEATKAREATNGIELHERRIRVDYSVTREPHKPTPGRYMGRPSARSRRYDSPRRRYRSRSRSRSRDRYRRSSPRRRYSRSRSRGRYSRSRSR